VPRMVLTLQISSVIEIPIFMSRWAVMLSFDLKNSVSITLKTWRVKTTLGTLWGINMISILHESGRGEWKFCYFMT